MNLFPDTLHCTVDNYASLDIARGGTLVQRYRQWPPGPPWGRYEPTGGAIIVTQSRLGCRAYVESGCSGPLQGHSTCCQVQVLERSPQGGEGAGLGYGTNLSSCTDLELPRERAPLPCTWPPGVRGKRSPPERATGVDLSRPWRAVSAGAGHRSRLESLLTIP